MLARTTTVAYVGLGSNLDDPIAQVGRALRELAGLPETRLTRTSALYRTAPMGPANQPDYINAVAELQTSLSPPALLEALQCLERAHARVRTAERWGPRTLDLDVLLYGDNVLEDPQLCIPHPGLAVRAFVLIPLAEIAPTLMVPGLGPLSGLLAALDPQGIERL